ncbi:unnamed protein product [Allacma fusca]|uniref:Uncharacterized protein n=1 Tax=Allacma fusca TaxID=39272 RepID=A0A8J2KPD7_9HEXA|nr:unnamed protein product [Allacma fusca]
MEKVTTQRCAPLPHSSPLHKQSIILLFCSSVVITSWNLRITTNSASSCRFHSGQDPVKAHRRVITPKEPGIFSKEFK